jgi:RNA polymerase I-specific transcription initiation factor RRN3
MVSLVPMVGPSAPTPVPKPLLRRATLSGIIRKSEDAGLDEDLLSAPPSPNKRARVTFNPKVEKKVMEEYTPKGRSLESVRAEVRRAIESHGRGDSEGCDIIKEVFASQKSSYNDESQEAKEEIKTYLLALTSYSSLLNKSCSDLVKAILACEWMGRDESFVKTYVHFLGSLASAHGAYVGMVLGMLVEHFHGGKTNVITQHLRI